MKHVNPFSILFIDIETVPAVAHYDQLDENWKQLWEAKRGRFKKDDENPADFYFNNAGIYAEFNKIVCISVGGLKKADGKCQLRVKSFSGHDEHDVLACFSDLLSNQLIKPEQYFLCGHNIKEFDIPVICRRMLVNGIQLPAIIDISGAKPWEVRHLDTIALWRFGDYKHYSSLNLLATLFGIPTSKDDIEGKDVGWVYWQKEDLNRIVTYCQKDVVTVARLFLRFVGQELLNDENVVVVKR